jgi:subtilisin family serine protease
MDIQTGVNVTRILEFLSHQPIVQFIEKAVELKLLNKYARGIVENGYDLNVNSMYNLGGTGLFSYDYNLTGSGQIIGIGDTGLDYKNCMFAEAEGTNPQTPPFKTYQTNAPATAMIQPSDLQRRKIVQYVGSMTKNSRADTDGHGTHVVGSALGYPANRSSKKWREQAGIARDAKIAFFDIGTDGNPNLDVPYNIQRDYLNWAYAAGARIHSNSWGSDSNSYSQEAVFMDSMTYTQKDFLILVAAGNSGTCISQAGTIGSPATAKNVISVGASLNSQEFWNSRCAPLASNSDCKVNSQFYNSRSVATFSSVGPCSDKRLKPDVVAPGFYIVSAKTNRTSANCSDSSFDSGTLELAGTSMATPILAGTVALIRQYLVEGYYPNGEKTGACGFNPSAALMKAIVINGAVALNGTKRSTATTSCSAAAGHYYLPKRPYYLQGFGRPQLSEALYVKASNSKRYMHISSLISATDTLNFYDKTIQNGKTDTYYYCLHPKEVSDEVRITLVWTDPPASANALSALVNDLDLIVLYDGQEIYGNSQCNLLKFVGLTRDSVNNVESIYLSGLNTTSTKKTIEVRVVGTSISALYPDQAYSLVVSGHVDAQKCESSIGASVAPAFLTSCPNFSYAKSTFMFTLNYSLVFLQISALLTILALFQ